MDDIVPDKSASGDALIPDLPQTTIDEDGVPVSIEDAFLFRPQFDMGQKSPNKPASFDAVTKPSNDVAMADELLPIASPKPNRAASDPNEKVESVKLAEPTQTKTAEVVPNKAGAKSSYPVKPVKPVLELSDESTADDYDLDSDEQRVYAKIKAKKGKMRAMISEGASHDKGKKRESERASHHKGKKRAKSVDEVSDEEGKGKKKREVKTVTPKSTKKEKSAAKGGMPTINLAGVLTAWGVTGADLDVYKTNAKGKTIKPPRLPNAGEAVHVTESYPYYDPNAKNAGQLVSTKFKGSFAMFNGYSLCSNWTISDGPDFVNAMDNEILPKSGGVRLDDHLLAIAMITLTPSSRHDRFPADVDQNGMGLIIASPPSSKKSTSSKKEESNKEGSSLATKSEEEGGDSGDGGDQVKGASKKKGPGRGRGGKKGRKSTK
ncbi:MAG: hypothetical protein Q9195_007481 [Heterodermia aff. obscurata]